MPENPARHSGNGNPRIWVAFTLSAAGVFLAMLSFAPAFAGPANAMTSLDPAKPTSPTIPFASSSTGGWQIIPSANADTTRHNEFNGVTCASDSDCWAVGDYYTPANAYQTLIEHWDGASWAIVPSANSDPTQTNLLNNVACVSSSDCWAVGKHKTIVQAGGGTLLIVDQTLIEHWDGAAWTIVTSPNSQPVENYLLDVTCTSTSDCWAVGYSKDVVSGLYQTLIEHWDGITWTLAPAPNAADRHNYLGSVACVSAGDCWTAGSSADPSSAFGAKTLVEHWNGSTWTLVPTPDASVPANSLGSSLSSVTCLSAANCWSVGTYDPGPGFGFQTLIERWDGNAWSIVSSPNTSPTRNNSLFGVACASASECWAIGRTYNGVAQQTLIERWDGASWNIVISPNTSTGQYNVLWRVDCASSSQCWSLGYYIDAGNHHQTLALHYTTEPPTPTSVVSRKTHGTAGTYDVDLPLTGNPGIECRSGGANGDYTLVFTFPHNTSVASASVTSGTATVSSSILGPNPNQYSVNLTGVSNAQYLTVTLNGALDSTGRSGTVVGPAMSVLVGDTTADGAVNSADVSQSKSKSGQAVDSTNFRQDVTAEGNLNSADIALVKSKSGTALP